MKKTISLAVSCLSALVWAQPPVNNGEPIPGTNVPAPGAVTPIPGQTNPSTRVAPRKMRKVKPTPSPTPVEDPANSVEPGSIRAPDPEAIDPNKVNDKSNPPGTKAKPKP